MLSERARAVPSSRSSPSSSSSSAPAAPRRAHARQGKSSMICSDGIVMFQLAVLSSCMIPVTNLRLSFKCYPVFLAVFIVALVLYHSYRRVVYILE